MRGITKRGRSLSAKDFWPCVTPLQRKKWCCNFKQVKCTGEGACLQRVATTCPIYIPTKLAPMSHSFVPLFPRPPVSLLLSRNFHKLLVVSSKLSTLAETSRDLWLLRHY